MWQTANKLLALKVILPTSLRGFVKPLHEAILVLVLALRRLDGQTVSYNTAIKLNFEPGSRVLEKNKLSKYHENLISGLSMLEGCLPRTHLKPNLHHLVHYAKKSMTHGSPRSWWMYPFERFVCVCMCACVCILPVITVKTNYRRNKMCKKMVGNTRFPEVKHLFQTTYFCFLRRATSTILGLIITARTKTMRKPFLRYIAS